VLPGDGRVLLIHKKRGLGHGLVNGPGGRLEPGEAPVAAAVREAREELCIEARDPSPAGRLRFHFVDGYKLKVHVFRTAAFDGVPSETDEALPEWFRVDAVPYDRMWADDPLWLPLLLAGRPFDGRFVFDGHAMLWHDVASRGPRVRRAVGGTPCKS
jgi:8-oxo-dGTP diphosphatase